MKVKFDDLVSDLENQNQQRQEQEQSKKQASKKRLSQKHDAMAIVEAVYELIRTVSSHEPKVEVKNHPDPITSVKTPDLAPQVERVLDKLDSIGLELNASKYDDVNVVEVMGRVVDALGKLPKEFKFPEIPKPVDVVTVKNQAPDYTEKFEDVVRAVGEIEVKPEVKVTVPKIDAPKVEITQDSRDFAQALTKLETAVKSIKPTDTIPLEKQLQKIKELLQGWGVSGGAGGTSKTEVHTSEPILKKLIDDTTTADVTYIGVAEPGTLTSASSWRVKKIDESSGVAITWANGGSQTQIWDDRETLAYS